MRFIVLLAVLIHFNSTKVSAQINQEPEQLNEITIYVMPSLFPINWESPAELYKTMYSGFIKTALEPDNYLLGHLAVQINSPLLEKPILTAMTSAEPSQRIDFILKDKIGYGILGATLKGRLETETELKKMLTTYSKRQKLAFITYKISEQSTKKILHFIDNFSHSQNNKPAASNYYGGAFWPRHPNEGAGCSAFGMALLDIANLLDADTHNWLIELNIPMSVIGGEFNNNKKVKISTVKKTKTWYKGSGKSNVDYVPYRVHDPSMIYQWILDQCSTANTKYKCIEKDGIPGLYSDRYDTLVKDEEPIFIERTENNIFINKYFEKIKTVNTTIE